MTPILKNATIFIQKKFPQATVTSREFKATDETGKELYKFWISIAQDPEHGLKQRLIVINNLGLNNEIQAYQSIFR